MMYASYYQLNIYLSLLIIILQEKYNLKKINLQKNSLLNLIDNLVMGNSNTINYPFQPDIFQLSYFQN